jgi:hypothetical protein
VYIFGCNLSLFRLCDSEFGITPIDIIIVIIIVVVVVDLSILLSICQKDNKEELS